MSENNKEDLAKNRKLLEVETKRFHTATVFAVRTSVATHGHEAPLPHVFGSYVFTRMCIGAETIERGLGRKTSFTLDHFSIAVLCRNIIEAGIMICYLLEDNVSEQQWELRRKILDLHDVLARLRLFKGLRPSEQAARFRH
jgi:hypothetical protein